MSFSSHRELLLELLTLSALAAFACSVWVEHEVPETSRRASPASPPPADEGLPVSGGPDASVGESLVPDAGPRLLDARRVASGARPRASRRDAGAAERSDGGSVGPAKNIPALRLAPRYVFWRGTKSYEAPAVGRSGSEPLATPIRAGSRDTRSGGRVRWEPDGSLHYAQPHARFWGEDGFAFIPEGDSEPLEVSISVQPGVLDGADLDAALGHGFSIVPAREGDSIGPLASIGDVDADGFDDMIVGVPNVALDGHRAGAAYVVRGRPGSASVSLQNLEAGQPLGWMWRGAQAGDELGDAVSAAGDVNGDGRDDFLVGAPGSDWEGAGVGVVYVVFGSDRLGSLVLDDLRRGLGGGFVIVAGSERGGFGSVLSAAGDANGDGLADVVVGAPTLDRVGRAYVVFGKEGPEPVFVESLGGSIPLGYAIAGSPGGAEPIGESLSPAGDVNKDGLDDLLVGASRRAGAAHIVYGKRDSATILLESVTLPPSVGVTWLGAFPRDGVGRDVASAADVNGDGRLDFLVGSRVHAAPREERGLTYVVFGAEPPFAGALGELEFGASGGIPIRGSDRGWGIGDANGDSQGDLLVPGFLLWGSPHPSPISTAELRARGSAAAVPFCDSFGPASRAGDVNGDGLADFLVRAPGQNAHVYFGWRAPRSWGPDALAPAPDALTLTDCSKAEGS